MVDYISYEGKEWPVLVGHLTIKDYENNTGELFQDIGEDMEKHARFLWFAIKTAHRKLKKEFFVDEKPAISMEDCLWMLDEKWPEYFGLVVNSLAQIADLSVEELVEKGKEIQAKELADKKKLTGKQTGSKLKPKPSVS